MNENKTINNKDKVFNIYYLNFSKIYEIAMMINNIVIDSIQKEHMKSIEHKKNNNDITESELGSKYLAKIKAVSRTEMTDTNIDNSKMIETLNVKTTKSILLREIEKKSKLVNNFDNLNEGDLIKIDNIKLDIFRKDNLREIQMLRKDALKGFKVEGMDINNMISSMLTDYSYVLTGKIEAYSDKEIIIKVPMDINDEFESKYNIYDLLIGKVSIIGVYKNEVIGEEIDSNTFEYFSKIGQEQKNIGNQKVIKSNQKNNNRTEISAYKNETKRYVFIDILAIIQNINFDNTISEISIEEQNIKKRSWFKGFFCKIRRKVQ